MMICSLWSFAGDALIEDVIHWQESHGPSGGGGICGLCIWGRRTREIPMSSQIGREGSPDGVCKDI